MRNKLSKFFVKFAIFMIVAQTVVGFTLINPIAAKAAELLPGDPGSIIINEIMWPGSSSSTSDEWIELKNMTNQAINFATTPWYLAKDGTIVAIINSGSVPAHGYYIISHYAITNPSTVLNIDPSIDPNMVLASLTLNNSDVQYSLCSEANTTAIPISCHNEIDIADDGNGSPLAGNNGTPKASMERTMSVGQVTDGRLASSWHTSTGKYNLKTGTTDFATPGYMNDFTAPVFSGVEDGKFYNTDVTVTPTDNDSIKTFKLDGSDATIPVTVINEGPHTVVATDQVGNTTTVGFTIDKTNPTINGIVDNQYYNSAVTLNFSDTNLKDATLNGVTANTGDVVSNEGNYVLVVNDKAGNSTTVHFTIDTTAPVITITKNPNADVSKVEYKININFNDAVTSEYSFDNITWKPYTAEIIVSDEGTYTVYARGTDIANNIGQSFAGFMIDKTAPTVTGIEEGKTYYSDVTIQADDNDTVGTITIDGNPIANGAKFGTEGVHVLVITDIAGNSTTVNFKIVKITAPVITSLMLDSDNRTINLKYSANGAVKTTIEFSKDSSFTQIVKTAIQEGSVIGGYVASGLEQGFTYYVRVTGYDGLGKMVSSASPQPSIAIPAPVLVAAVVEDTSVLPIGGPVGETFVSQPKAAPKTDEVTPTPAQEPKGETKGTEDTKAPKSDSKSRDILVIIALLAIAGAAYYGYKKLPESDEITEPKKMKIEEKPEIKIPEKTVVK